MEARPVVRWLAGLERTDLVTEQPGPAAGPGPSWDWRSGWGPALSSRASTRQMSCSLTSTWWVRRAALESERYPQHQHYFRNIVVSTLRLPLSPFIDENWRCWSGKNIDCEHIR